jgi:hypothetical protein
MPIDDIVLSGSVGLWLLIIDAVLVTVFMLGLETVVFAMIPMTFLLGSHVFQWRRKIWVAVYLPVMLLFLFVLFTSGKVKQAGEVNTWTDVAEVLAPFIVFGVLSLVFWAHFRFRPYRKHCWALVERWSAGRWYPRLWRRSGVAEVDTRVGGSVRSLREEPATRQGSSQL